MPELPEVRSFTEFVNTHARGHVFNRVTKSLVSKLSDFSSKVFAEFSIHALARGKEMKMVLTDHSKENKGSTTSILFKFGMTGYFAFFNEGEEPKHTHLKFYTTGNQVLGYVDTRRLGRWEYDSDFSLNSYGPDPITDYAAFVDNIKNDISTKAAFNRPICELLLNQKYFNGIGNYLRAEILHRADVNPFAKSRDVLILEQPSAEQENTEIVLNNPFLQICRDIPNEVIQMGLYGYSVREADFRKWLQCYGKLSKAKDTGKRTIWFAEKYTPTNIKQETPTDQKKDGAKEKKVLRKRKRSIKVEVNMDDSSVVVSGGTPESKPKIKKEKTEADGGSEGCDSDSDFKPKRKRRRLSAGKQKK